MTSKYDKIEQLNKLKKEGAITDEEFEAEKKKILSSPNHNMNLFGEHDEDHPWGLSLNNYCLLLHVSQFFGFLIPGLGLATPIVMWLSNKENELVDLHGKNVANWIITKAIFYVAGFFLIFVFIGVPLLAAVAILDIIFIIQATLKASKGEIAGYPLSIKFIK
ncbi:MAG: DUF4870 domain-containing protein [Flavobacteriales bacterium]|nr:DUF4870 domain-containing protein [Flavobacteriales bacterium]